MANVKYANKTNSELKEILVGQGKTFRVKATKDELISLVKEKVKKSTKKATTAPKQNQRKGEW